MENHQAGQREALVEVVVDRLGGSRLATGSPALCHRCFKCVVALAILMGLAVVVLGLILLFNVFVPSGNQDAPPLNDAATVTKYDNVNGAYSLKKTDEPGLYDVFTADKAAVYLIYGWVKFSSVPASDVTLRHTLNDDYRNIEILHANKTMVFFFDKITLLKESRISVYTHSAFTDSLFHVYEL